MNRLLLVVAFLCAACTSLQAQFVYIGIGGGFCSTTPTSDYAFTYKNDAAWGWSGRFLETTGQKSDIGFNITSSIEFQLPTAPISLTAGISYVQLYGTTESVKANSPPWYNTVFTVGELKTRSNLLTIRSGAKWGFTSIPAYSPYLSLELLYNIIGETNLSIHTTSSTIDAVVDGNTSFGLSLGVGCAPAFSRRWMSASERRLFSTTWFPRRLTLNRRTCCV